MRGATGVALQPNHILRLPRKMTHDWFFTYETSFTMRGATALTLQRYQISRLPRKMTHMIDASHI